MLKKTEYFNSQVLLHYEVQKCTNEVVAKRDAFIEKNKNNIIVIENENIKFTSFVNGSHCSVLATLTLTYSPLE